MLETSLGIEAVRAVRANLLWRVLQFPFLYFKFVYGLCFIVFLIAK